MFICKSIQSPWPSLGGHAVMIVELFFIFIYSRCDDEHSNEHERKTQSGHSLLLVRLDWLALFKFSLFQMRLVITADYNEMAEWSARYIRKRINDFQPAPNRLFVLGLPTGSTPLGTYKKLIEMVKKNELSFKYVVTFNMDEYVGLRRVRNERSCPWRFSFCFLLRIIRKVTIRSCGIISSSISILIRTMFISSTGMPRIWSMNATSTNVPSEKQEESNCSSVGLDPMVISPSTNQVFDRKKRAQRRKRWSRLELSLTYACENTGSRYDHRQCAFLQ